MPNGPDYHYFVLRFNFSGVAKGSAEEFARAFNENINNAIEDFLVKYSVIAPEVTQKIRINPISAIASLKSVFRQVDANEKKGNI